MYNHPKKKKFLPYKNLTELYLETAFQEPAITRFLSEEKEATILIQKKDDPDVHEFNVTNDTADRVRKVIRKSGSGEAVLIERLFSLSGFKNVQTFELVKLAFDVGNVDVTGLDQIINAKKEKKLSLLNEYIDHGTAFNIKDKVLVPAADKITDNGGELVTNLFKVSIGEGTVGVGPGEICISLLTNFSKAVVGDLESEGLKIEVKAFGGRLGKGKHALDFIDFAKDYLKSLNLKSSLILPKNRKTIYGATKNLETIMIKRAINTPDLLEIIEIVETSNLSTMDVQGVQEFINKINSAMKASPLALVRNELKRILEALTKSLSASVTKGPAWGQTVRDFFLSDYGLTTEQIVYALAELRTEPFDENGAAELRHALNGIITTPDYFLGGDGEKRLSDITLAIQAASYQQVEGFNVLLVINEDFKAVPLKFPGSMGENIVSLLGDITTHGITTGFAVDPKFKGVSILLGK